MKISELLKAYTKLNEVAVRQIAKEIGVSPSTVSRIEIGKNIDGDSMIKVINWLFIEPKKVEVWDEKDPED